MFCIGKVLKKRLNSSIPITYSEKESIFDKMQTQFDVNACVNSRSGTGELTPQAYLVLRL